MKRLFRESVNSFIIMLGVLCAGLGLKGFLLASNFIDGGVTGASMLLSKTTGLSLALLLPLINLPFIAIGYHQMGGAFTVRSVAGIAGLAVVIAFVPYPVVTKDLLLVAVFGGFFLGAGIGLAVRCGAVLDGTEIAALLISKRSVLLNVGDVILGFNVLLFVGAIFVIGVEDSLYSILTYMTAAKTLDFVLYGLDEFTAITIVSDASAAIRERITDELGRGVTVYKGFGGKSGADKEILYCVVTRLEINRVRRIVRDIDARAFVVFHPLAGAEGGLIKRMSHYWKTTIKNFR